MSADASSAARESPGVRAVRGDTLSFTADPFLEDPSSSVRFLADALIVMQDGVITALGPARELLPVLPDGAEVTRYPDALILPGFIDTHVHYPQTQIIGAYGAQLIEWLTTYTFVAEQAFDDLEHARRTARLFLRECLRNGTTTCSVFGTVHATSVEAFFEASEALGMRNIAGKLLMDRNAPEALLDTPQSGVDDSEALIKKWHGRGRQLYAVTPRFAPTSSPEQLELAGELWRAHPGTYLQSHLSENLSELDWVAQLFPERKDYLDVYEHYGQVGPRAIFGHGIHLSESELQRCHDSGTALAHCPSSNMFLGSGLLDVQRVRRPGRAVKLGLATDLGAGTSFSMLRTMLEAYKVSQLRGQPLGAIQAYYLATRGAAEALQLEQQIGSLEVGSEADLVVLDLHATELLRERMRFCESLAERLFVLMTLGDDRATRATWIGGACAYDRDASRSPR